MDVRFSARYNMLVERWFLLLNDATTFVSLVLFSSVLLFLLKSSESVATLAAAIGATLQAINITYGSVRRAQTHRDLYKQYQELDSKIASGVLTLSAADEAYRKIEVGDPAQSARFSRIAHYENLQTHGYEEETRRAKAELTLADRVVRSML